MTSIHDDDPGSRSAAKPAAPRLASLQPIDWERLARRKDELDTVLAAGRIGYCRLRGTDRAVEANSQFKAEWGWPPDEQLSWPAVEARVHPEDRSRFFEATRQALATASSLDLTVRVRPAAGATRWIALRGSLVRDVDEAERADLIITSHNVTIELHA